MSLLDRHIGFVEALRGAGLTVSLAEDIDAAQALMHIDFDDRETVRATYAATLCKRDTHRPGFDALFDLWFPALIGDGRLGSIDTEGAELYELATKEGDRELFVDDGPESLAEFREQLGEALESDDRQRIGELAIFGVGTFGSLPGQGPGRSTWSAYTAMKRVRPEDFAFRIMQALEANGIGEEEARATATRRIASFTGLAEADAIRRIAQEKGVEQVGSQVVPPTIDKLDFLSMRRTDIEEMRRQIYPLARRLATRLTQEHHAKRRGPLDFRRTVRASISTGGVPLTTHHKPKRPHKTELVVLCDVSGSVANFASFTLLLVFALREQFGKVRAFTFVDDIVEVTDAFVPGGDLVDIMTELVEQSAHAARFGRTNYGRAFKRFQEKYADALGPKSSLLILGDARSNYADLQLDVLRDLVDKSKKQWWLNPEVRRNWDTGDSVATRYADLVPMAECRNLTQLSEFVHDIL
jgi:uncharacterized protein with von Willebrand factor type A (vWA) domain